MAPLLYLSYFLLAGLQAATLVVAVPMSVQMLLSATLVLYIGAMLSLSQEVAEEMSQGDAMQFPLLAGGALGALFVAFRYLPAVYINALLTVYFCAVGAITVGQLFEPLLRLAVIPARSRGVTLCTLRLPYLDPIVVSVSDAVCLVPGAAVALWYGATRHYIGNNILGASFAVEGIKRISLGRASTGLLLLAGLFVYDIVMVFYTPMMVEVATKLEGPIKLLFPRGAADPITGKLPMSLLGLGDIVIPGIFLALLLRFDALTALRSGAFTLAGHASPLKLGAGGVLADPAVLSGADFHRPLFNVALLAYVGGLVLTVAVMLFFDAAQPALLYLVPAVLLAAAGTSLALGRFNALMVDYSDEDYATELVKGGTAAAPAAGAPAAAAASVKESGAAGASKGAAAEPAAAAVASPSSVRRRKQQG